MYIPELGRFLQIDPVEGGTLNNYTYPNDPVNQVDPSGEFAWFFIRTLVVFIATKITPKQAAKQTVKQTVKTTAKQAVKSGGKQQTRATVKQVAVQAPKQVTVDASKTIDYLKSNSFKYAQQGFKGGSRWANDGRAGSQILPNQYLGKPITYTEWDVKPIVQGVNRGAERIISGSDGSIWHTIDHYKTIVRIE